MHGAYLLHTLRGTQLFAHAHDGKSVKTNASGAIDVDGGVHCVELRPLGLGEP